jgi:hypothetical protein
MPLANAAIAVSGIATEPRCAALKIPL